MRIKFLRCHEGIRYAAAWFALFIGVSSNGSMFGFGPGSIIIGADDIAAISKGIICGKPIPKIFWCRKAFVVALKVRVRKKVFFFVADIALHSKLSVISGHDATLAASYQEIEIKIREISNAFTAV